MAQLKALLFDVDGTLADTERDGHRVAFNKAFTEAGLDWQWSPELYGELLAVTGGKERIRFFVESFLENSGFTSPMSSNDVIAFAAQMHQRKTHFYLEMLQAGDIPLRVGVERLFSEVRAAGYRLAIVTTTTPENVTYLLTATLGKASLDWFEVIAAGDIVPAKKPAPDIYEYALDKMGLQADECLAFEDSENGILSSAAAKIPTLITTNAYTDQHDFGKAALVVDQLGEPDQPFTIKQGDAFGFEYVNADLLARLHGAIT